MKLFSRGKDEQATATAGTAPGGVSVVPTPSPAGPAVAPAQEPAVDAAMEASVKEMSEKITRLSRSLETVTEERTAFEDKLTRMEDRMRKLASLTEMISAPYNPFVGDAPPERESLVPAGASANGLAPVLEPPVARPAPEPAPTRAPPAPPAPAATVPDALDMPRVADLYPRLDASTAEEEHDGQDGAVPAAAAAMAQLARVEPGFQTSLLLLNWADMLVKAARSRDGVKEILEYYHSIGWIGEEVRSQLLAYANGIAIGPRADAKDWRGNVELHERSLLFMEKLRQGTRP